MVGTEAPAWHTFMGMRPALAAHGWCRPCPALIPATLMVVALRFAARGTAPFRLYGLAAPTALRSLRQG